MVRTPHPTHARVSLWLQVNCQTPVLFTKLSDSHILLRQLYLLAAAVHCQQLQHMYLLEANVSGSTSNCS